ncbi:DUF397 domain-containing protein [Marinitenerispora sediminis]|uniref:DUF397 domain-containing protein n=1 Tax=Marinitenerispora sediminis TaxID=1931232 RepID=A0A368T0S9_9ACTN|nr:DUF397 domain-containing protein [Marinitenerispora sediminis]RCV50266.1 DUF397 domain-containing protein [Marinitenerispora sediminis]RCV50475.1 DUF397 domain-containing protein [Marinitenerispora sediminis]RCV52838.1 DUF397 domain-containing protein [Marinitenerispora sediminis]
MLAASRLDFRKSSYSQAKTQNCVEVADLPGGAAVRDSQNPDAGFIVFPAAEMAVFLADVKRDRL